MNGSEDQERVYRVKLPDFITKRAEEGERPEKKKIEKDFQSLLSGSKPTEASALDIKSFFCKYCNIPFYTERSCETHILIQGFEKRPLACPKIYQNSQTIANI